MTKYQNKDIEIIKEEIIYTGFNQLKKVYFKHKLFNGQMSDIICREIFVRHHACALIAYDPDHEKVALIEQIRIATYNPTANHSPWLLELIAGIIDAGETPEQTIVREAKEEAGLTVSSLELACSVFESPGSTYEKLYLFAGKVDLSITNSNIFGVATEDEDIKLHIFSLNDALNLLTTTETLNGITVMGLQWLALHHHRLKEKWQ